MGQGGGGMAGGVVRPTQRQVSSQSSLSCPSFPSFLLEIYGAAGAVKLGKAFHRLPAIVD